MKESVVTLKTNEGFIFYRVSEKEIEMVGFYEIFDTHHMDLLETHELKRELAILNKSLRYILIFDIKKLLEEREV